MYFLCPEASSGTIKHKVDRNSRSHLTAAMQRNFSWSVIRHVSDASPLQSNARGKWDIISHRTSTASSMTVMSVLHLAEGLMASSAGGMTKLLLNGSHIPSPKVYVNLQRTRSVDKVTSLGFKYSKDNIEAGENNRDDRKRSCHDAHDDINARRGGELGPCCFIPWGRTPTGDLLQSDIRLIPGLNWNKNKLCRTFLSTSLIMTKTDK